LQEQLATVEDELLLLQTITDQVGKERDELGKLFDQAQKTKLQLESRLEQIVAILQQVILSPKQGGSFTRNNASKLRIAIEQLLQMLGVETRRLPIQRHRVQR